MSFEWHEFKSAKATNWGKSFHPDSVEICLNLDGRGSLNCRSEKLEYKPLTSGFYFQGDGSIDASRLPQDQHRFITVEFSRNFLRQHLAGAKDLLHPLVKEAVLSNKAKSGATQAGKLNSRQQDLIANLRRPPVVAGAQFLWYQSRAFDLMAEFFFQGPEDEFFCHRQQRVALERVERVKTILATNLSAPPTLEEIGKQVGCSPFYLSRTFSKEMDKTIPQYLRQIRMERAAELLQAGKLNVTEVALEIGYSSLSHFSTAFHETFGCCPGLYPVGLEHFRKINPMER